MIYMLFFEMTLFEFSCDALTTGVMYKPRHFF